MIGYLGLGSNVGERRVNLQRAIELLDLRDVAVLASSSTYDTDPVGEVLRGSTLANRWGRRPLP